MTLDLRIMRQGTDPTAESSLHALRDIMGLPVLAVEHGELLRFAFSADVDVVQARQVLERAACRAGRYVNVNRDAVLWDDAASTQVAPEAGYRVDLWVRQRGGGDARALQWFRQHTELPVSSVERGRWYRIHVTAPDAAEARRRVEELAVSRARRNGLLANPHAEAIVVLRVEPNVGGGVSHVV